MSSNALFYDTTLLLGKPADYWIELRRLIEERNLERVFDELVVANAKVRYFERMLTDAEQFIRAVDRKERAHGS